MAALNVFPILVLNSVLLGVFGIESILEKHCTKFEFEEKVLEKLIKLDVKVQNSLQEMELAIKEIKSSQEGMVKQNDAFKENSVTKVEDIYKQNEAFKDTIVSKVDNMLKQNIDFRKETDTKIEHITGHVTTRLSATQTTLQQFMEAVNQTINATIEQQGDIALRGQGMKYQTAFIAHTPDNSLTYNAAIKYGTVLLNIGDGYNAATGKFTATATGMYLFFVQICNRSGYTTSYQVIVNNVIYSASRIISEYEGDCSSVTTVAFLKTGEDVWVKCVQSGATISTNSVQHWTMFSGILVNRVAE